VAEQAGAQVLQLNGEPLSYNKGDEVLNPHFIVYADPGTDWLAMVQ
jgi:3'-phosphoadenosine 5'-phosphosulfate (PAPS) 3'-phosphatase